MNRIKPLEPPFDAETEARFAKWMPPGTEDVEPLALFRLLEIHPELASRMRPLGSGLLGKPKLSLRDRELLIARTTARCKAGYEWGVHITFFARPHLRLTEAQIRSTATGSPMDEVWDQHDSAVLRLADELHDTCTVTDETLAILSWTDDLVLEAVICCGWYRLLSGVINAAQLAPEPWAEVFPS
jgi:hypothetical protein